MALFSRKTKPTPSTAVVPPTSAGGGANGGGGGGKREHEAQLREIGEEMLGRARGYKSGVFSAKFYSDALMDWSMKDQNFKVQMFRFVDTFPVLRTPEDVFDHLTDYLSQPGVTVPGAVSTAIAAGKVSKTLGAAAIGKAITSMAEKFIMGVDAASALPNLRALWKEGIAFSVDLLGEACVGDLEADAYQAKYLDLISNLPGQVAGWGSNPRLESDHLGAIPRTNVSVKISSLSARCDPIDSEGAMRDLMKRLVPILEAAQARGVFVNFDMEQFALKDFTIELFRRCCERVPFEAGLAMQAYLRSGEEDARKVCAWAATRKRAVTVRLVKGAYWDYEVINAEQRGWPTPVWPTKRQTDACFERMASIFLDATPRREGEGGVKLALGSHNVRSIAAALAGAKRRGLPVSALEFQMLHGMADQLKHAAAEMGLRIREYVPVGQMIPGMAYLVRRLLENTSNESWLKAGFLDQADPAVLLADPAGGGGAGGAGGGTGLELGGASPGIDPAKHNLSPAPAELGVGAFMNEAFRDFSIPEVHRAFAGAVERARVPVVANDKTPRQGAEMVERAERVARAWGDVPAADRARVLLFAAEGLRARRDELSALMVKEAGKTWREADADTCEAVDFCEYYARTALELFSPARIGRFVGELDEQWHQPRGVAVVISPWNFPLAICCGMTVAALVTGNPVVVKPAEQTPAVAEAMVRVLREAIERAAKETRGVGALSAAERADVLHLCPAPGETTGATLVRDPRVALIAFTGSKAVGLDIIAAAGATPTGQGHVKKVIAEMGGKNAVIVDTSADLDEAVLGVRHSAFGFQGQKCSACSRLIVVDPEGARGPAVVRFRERVVEAMRALTIGDPSNPGTDVGPVIDAEAKAKITGFIERAKASGLPWAGLEVPAGLEGATGRSYVAPHVFWEVPENHELANEEIFGPVLAVLHAKDFDDALRIANATPYKLTGGVFTRKPAHLAKARREFRVGNLYLNRGITGALVARQPFGGFGMSGVGSKAGGAQYLLQFVEPRAVCENTMRRGFAPEN
jgi:RHH-type proline utilization regulon transcriptional repressor/proline dehydrogenase/delta 1-pyrroline-5-carboxylate dehydrogenase